MLLNQIISSQHALYAEIQTQIESLQEQQRQIQAHLQRLGSVESKMESAAQLVAEAIAEINAVCPDELANYATTITSLFGSSPIAQLSASDSEPPTPPTPPTTDNDSTTIETSAVTVEDEVSTARLPETEILTTNDSAITGNTNGNSNGNSNGNGHHSAIYTDRLLEYEDLRKHDKNLLGKFAKKHGVEGKTKNDLAQALAGMISQSEMEAAISSNGRV